MERGRETGRAGAEERKRLERKDTGTIGAARRRRSGEIKRNQESKLSQQETRTEDRKGVKKKERRSDCFTGSF